MTEKDALKETVELWKEIACVTRVKRKRTLKEDIPGPWRDYPYTCPCCKYVVTAGCLDCLDCPMVEEWKYYSDLSKNDFGVSHRLTLCSSRRSPYTKWMDLPSSCSCMDREFFALLIAEMAEDALTRYRGKVFSRFLAYFTASS